MKMIIIMKRKEIKLTRKYWHKRNAERSEELKWREFKIEAN